MLRGAVSCVKLAISCVLNRSRWFCLLLLLSVTALDHIVLFGFVSSSSCDEEITDHHEHSPVRSLLSRELCSIANHHPPTSPFELSLPSPILVSFAFVHFIVPLRFFLSTSSLSPTSILWSRFSCLVVRCPIDDIRCVWFSCWSSIVR